MPRDCTTRGETFTGSVPRPVESLGQLANFASYPKHKRASPGLPSPPLLFMLYITDTERQLGDAGGGFDMSFSREGELVGRKIPGVIYADDQWPAQLPRAFMHGFDHLVTRPFDTAHKVQEGGWTSAFRDVVKPAAAS